MKIGTRHSRIDILCGLLKDRRLVGRRFSDFLSGIAVAVAFTSKL
jgi:hypothetical protein